jgi:hypothetical protein
LWPFAGTALRFQGNSTRRGQGFRGGTKRSWRDLARDLTVASTNAGFEGVSSVAGAMRFLASENFAGDPHSSMAVYLSE